MDLCSNVVQISVEHDPVSSEISDYCKISDLLFGDGVSRLGFGLV